MATYASVRALQTVRVNEDRANGAYDPGTLTGTVETKTGISTWVPQFAVVYVVRDHDHMVVRKGQSDPATGAFAFYNLDKGMTYTVEAFHPTQAYRAIIADGVTPT